MKNLILLSVLVLCACAKPPPQRMMEHDAPAAAISPPFSQNYINRLEAMCYAQIQKTVGENRPYRGVIWAECMAENVRPVEMRNMPDRSRAIDAMYQSLLSDMHKYYSGQTTLELLHARWERQQRAIGYQATRRYTDRYQL